MKPHEQCKEAGLKSLAELTKISNVCKDTLIHWSKHKPKLFSIVILGSKVLKEKAETSCFQEQAKKEVR